MITRSSIYPTLILIMFCLTAVAQENDNYNYRDSQSTPKNSENIQTIFTQNGSRQSGAYAALSNKFTTFDGHFANMVELYGGWFINRKLLIGFEAAAVTNDIPVPSEYSSIPGVRMSYEYGQVGLMTEYVIASNKSIHVNVNLVTGAGFTVQYDRWSWEDYDYDNYDRSHNQDWFFIMEPGVQVEINLLKWMRFSPGVSYRFAQNSNSEGLSDADISGASMNVTLKFGKF